MVLTMSNWALAVTLDTTMASKKMKVELMIYDVISKVHQKYELPTKHPLKKPYDSTYNTEPGTRCMSISVLAWQASHNFCRYHASLASITRGWQASRKLDGHHASPAIITKAQQGFGQLHKHHASQASNITRPRQASRELGKYHTSIMRTRQASRMLGNDYASSASITQA